MSAWVPDEDGGYTRELSSGVALAVDRDAKHGDVSWTVLADGDAVDIGNEPNVTAAKRAAEESAIALLRADLADLEGT